VTTIRPTYVREYLVTLCAFDDGDVVPVCMFAAIKPPDDCDNEDVPGLVSRLMEQIAEELPEYMADPERYGVVPPPHARFWECAPNPVEVEEGAIPVEWVNP
jgi:hypothetical protein